METIVIDASIAVALLVELPWSARAEQALLTWKSRKARLCAPALFPGEVVSALRKAVYLGKVDHEDALKLVTFMDSWGIQVCPADTELNRNSLVWAERLAQVAAYEAQYLALAERLSAEFYTTDQKLYQRCREIGAQFVKLLQ